MMTIDTARCFVISGLTVQATFSLPNYPALPSRFGTKAQTLRRPVFPEPFGFLRIAHLTVAKDGIHLPHEGVYRAWSDNILGIHEPVVPEVRLVVRAGGDAGATVPIVFNPEPEALL